MEMPVRMAVERQNPWWLGKKYDHGIPRLARYPDIGRYLHLQEVLVLLGARRTGKSTLVFQIIDSLIQEGTPAHAILYLNLDDPVLGFHAQEPGFFMDIIERYQAEHGGIRYLCIDEVQLSPHWAATVKVLYDTQPGIRTIITGSNSQVVEHEMSLRLSGRYLPVRVFPLDFGEFLSFTGKGNSSSAEQNMLARQYVRYGGFPRIVLERDEEVKDALLRQYYETIYLKDILTPRMIRSTRDLVSLLYICLSQSGTVISYQRLADSLNITAETVKEYIGYAEDAYLLYTVRRFDYSAHRQESHIKKIYCADTGLMNAVAYSFSENSGHLMENLVFTTLLRQSGSIWYHKGRYECDFIITGHGKPVQAIQVCMSLRDEQTRKREIRGLLEATGRYGLSEGTIITREEEGMEMVGDTRIQIIPLARWLLDAEKW
jgi:predicted AAA+ superfamily ATPase